MEWIARSQKGFAQRMWEERLFDEVVGRYGEPAYVRRGRAVEHAYQDLLDHCRARRREWLHMVRVRLGVLFALAGGRDALVPLLRDEEEALALERLHSELAPALRVPIEPTTSRRALSLALIELTESMERFNRRWREYLPTVDLSRVNDLRTSYNRYYILEKECATHSASVARQGFQPLEPLTSDDLADRLPPLPLPQLKE
jgi:hypothetical protein